MWCIIKISGPNDSRVALFTFSMVITALLHFGLQNATITIGKVNNATSLVLVRTTNSKNHKQFNTYTPTSFSIAPMYMYHGLGFPW
jgi:hypothetical protein